MKNTLSNHSNEAERFPSSEVLQSEHAIKLREHEIRHAADLGRQFSLPVVIDYINIEGKRMVESAIIGVNKDSVTVKTGQRIPKRCILNVWIY